MNRNTRFLTALLILVMAFTACQPVAGPPPVAMDQNAPEAVDVVQALADALNASDLEAAMKLIADDAEFYMGDEEPALVGIDQFRGLFGELTAGNFRIEALPQEVNGSTVTTETKTWGDGIPGGGPNIATEVYVVENGKITSISWTPSEETIANMMAAMAAVESTVNGLAAALNAGDVDAAMALIAEDAVFQMDFYDETLIGADQFRSLFDELVAGNFRIELTPQNIDEWTATTETKTWGDGIPGGGPNIATEVYVVEDGKITSITWTPTAETIANLTAAMDATEAEPAYHTFTVTFDGDQCALDGPDPWLSSQRTTIVLDVTDQDAYDEYGIVAVTLNEGKTMADLEAWPSTDPPLWISIHSIIDEVPQGRRVERDLRVAEGPVYFVCFTAYPIRKTDVAGPIEVVAQ